MNKDTSKILEELNLCSDFSTFYDKNKQYMVSEKLPQMLDRIIKEKNLKKSQVIKHSEIAEVYAYQIFSGLRKPERKKLLSLTIAMKLDLDETQTILKCAGYNTLYAKIPFDSIVIYGINKKMSVIEINNLLFNNNLETLG